MVLRKFHRTVGMIFGPFFLLTSLTGIMLLFRKDDLYSGEAKSFLIGLHNWEIAAKYVGVVLAAGLITMIITGFFIAMQIRKARAKASAHRE